MENAEIILNGYPDFYCVRGKNSIVILNQHMKKVQ